MYKLTHSTSIIRLSDSAFIPADPANTDWQQYQQWLAEGNTPLPVDQPTPEEIQAAKNAEARAYLASTDWYVIRQQETGTPIPPDILAKRQEARDSVIQRNVKHLEGMRKATFWTYEDMAPIDAAIAAGNAAMNE